MRAGTFAHMPMEWPAFVIAGWLFLSCVVHSHAHYGVPTPTRSRYVEKIMGTIGKPPKILNPKILNFRILGF